MKPYNASTYKYMGPFYVIIVKKFSSNPLLIIKDCKKKNF